MKLLKLSVPLLIVIILALIAREYYQQLPASLVNAMQYFPTLLIIIVAAITIHFNQIRVLAYLIVISAYYFLNRYAAFDDSLKVTLFASFAPFLILVARLLKQQGVFTIRALPLYLIYIFSLGFALWLIREQPSWGTHFFSQTWLPVGLFEWTQLPQTSLIIFILTFVGLFGLLSVRQDQLTLTGIFVVVLLFLGLHFQPHGRDLVILVSSGLILCLVNVLQESWKMAYLDELTQLPGRRALREKLQSLIGIYTIAMVDIDYFKKFNDSYGHETGDEALRMIANKLKAVTGGGNAYRYGGEEFTIVFSNKSVSQVKQHLEELRQTIEGSPFLASGKTSKSKAKAVPITISIGVADCIDISTAEETLKKADKALYRAKKKGRNCIAT